MLFGISNAHKEQCALKFFFKGHEPANRLEWLEKIFIKLGELEELADSQRNESH